MRSVIEAFNEGRLHTRMIGEPFDSELEVLDFPEVPDRGHDGVNEFLADLAENWEGTRISIEKIRELGGAANAQA
ncbi:MAG: hypothetical protein EXQ70_06730 [Solirubrobacterales bacterium]|nr:hypothetical protein [Solirubrobacterales bacterium]